MKQLIFPKLRQTYEWDCGAKALQAVLAYYGIEVRQELLIEYAKTNPKEGTSIQGMQHVLEKFELKFDAKKMTIDDLKNYIHKQVPIIVLLQAWNEENMDYSNNFNDGHWVVAIGYDENKIIFEDPYSLNRTFLKNEELAKRWHGKENGDKILSYGIAVFGENPKYDPDKIIPMR